MKYQRFNRFFVILFALSLIFFGQSIIAQTRSKKSLSQSQKAEVFNKVWKLINTRYYDPKMNGVNWLEQKTTYEPLARKTTGDEEFYDVLKKMVGEMNDAHTRFLTPREAKEDRAKKGTSVGILLSNIEGKTVVEKVRLNAKGELAKVREGMRVRTIDDKTIEEKLSEARQVVGGSSSNRASEIMAYRRILRGEPETSVKIGLTDENGKDFDVTLVRKVIDQSSEVISRKLPSGIGYIAVTSFRSPVSGKFKKALLELRGTQSLVVDLRYNGGGSISEVLKMAGYLLNKNRTFGQFMRRSGKTKQSLRKFSAGKRGGQIYSKPIVVLTSKYSASGSELFASSLQEFGRAKVIGTQTCGCLLGISRKHKIKGGGELHISDIGFLSSKGKVYEKVGVTPDKVVEIKIADLRNGIDRGIEEAEKMQNNSLTDF